MYNITVTGRTGAEPDIAKVRFYINGTQNAEIDVTPQPNVDQTPFTATLTYPSAGAITLGYSFVDTSGNESGVHAQAFTVPDKEAPAMPGGDLNVTAVVWTPAP